MGTESTLSVVSRSLSGSEANVQYGGGGGVKLRPHIHLTGQDFVPTHKSFRYTALQCKQEYFFPAITLERVASDVGNGEKSVPENNSVNRRPTFCGLCVGRMLSGVE